jgi:hypothetical protein
MQATRKKKKKNIYIYNLHMFLVEFERSIPEVERSGTIHALHESTGILI